MCARKNSATYELRIKSDPSHIGGNDVLSEVLIRLGIPQKEIVECSQWPESELSVYFNSRNKAIALQIKIRQLGILKIKVSIKRIYKKDWQTKWKNDFKPFALTSRFQVVPQAYRNKYKTKRTPIYIDSDLAFGTGLHATTRFMAQFIQRLEGNFESFFDVGTGSGILSVIASHCGAKQVSAIDISKDAVRVAQANLKRNQCETKSIRVADAYKLSGQAQYDFVCANIITYDLIQIADRLVRLVRPGKYLALSGVSVKSYDLLRESYKKYPLRCIKVEKGEGWTAVLFMKRL